jgi:thiosulfate dehydrogenase [quinone] large subunit
MGMYRHNIGLALLRIFLGVFFLFQGIGKVRWFIDSSILAGQLAQWHQTVPPGSLSARYLEHVAIPFTNVFARLVPIGEISCGLAMVLGLWTDIFAAIAFVMVMSFHVASGTIFTYGFLTNGYGLPVLGGTLALAFGGVRLPWSLGKS